MTGQFKAFLFDLGNVLIRFDHWVAAQRIGACANVSPEALYRLFFESPLVVDHDEGRITTRAFYEGVKTELGFEISYEGFLQAWNDIFTEDPGMTALAEALLARYPCFLISNTNPAHFEFCRTRFPVIDRFNGRILSYEVGALKPHPRIYQWALQLIGLPASQIFYVDDREDLIEAARGIGFQVHRFAGAGPLVEELRTKGISTAMPGAF